MRKRRDRDRGRRPRRRRFAEAVALFVLLAGALLLLVDTRVGGRAEASSHLETKQTTRTALEATRAAEIALAEENYGRARHELSQVRRTLEALLEEERRANP